MTVLTVITIVAVIAEIATIALLYRMVKIDIKIMMAMRVVMTVIFIMDV